MKRTLIAVMLFFVGARASAQQLDLDSHLPYFTSEDRTNSGILSEVGDEIRLNFDYYIDIVNQQLDQEGFNYRLQVVDGAIYNRFGDEVVEKVNVLTGYRMPVARLLSKRPGYFSLMHFQTGAELYSFNYDVWYIEFRRQPYGKVGWCNRYKSGHDIGRFYYRCWSQYEGAVSLGGFDYRLNNYLYQMARCFTQLPNVDHSRGACGTY